MRKYKLHKGKEQGKLRDDEIEEYKDYSKLMGNYNNVIHGIHKKPLYKNPKMFIALVMIVLVAWLLSTDFDGEGGEKEAPAASDSTETVQLAP